MTSIWHHKPDSVLIAQMSKGTIDEHLDIKITDVGDDYITGTMPANSRTFQPYGIVHGGANVVLAETLGSLGGAHVIDMATARCLGQEVSATHLRPVSSGLVTGTARPIHLGRRSHVWEVRLTNDQGKLTCIAKLILAIVPN
ncbi:MAG: hotdog fold thioesterase [Porticoccaceae bacterium]|jgi:1,4-dihydroxy-2-naphthoyl-CoA hydrolase|nr:hotdog fold thioesterase [Porticoccaceae bacterium]MBT3798111.1 hotdog fold thioesterase [Porticoccaceae bacterium]MBT4164895.1 hotdog fold thioesterase [Porticoccaceae bacterium]MBT4212422.1 hotdog fold thioesterase [Porticoccaceae bacterium]MBT4592354.1 hotdog fold thioesterase [Porticoccaceae bacterium]|tara:strand:+ start:1262 stop:1687 length:426 start_codon:yes stop_codon:yes gene_type:complete